MTPLQAAAQNLLQIFHKTGNPIDAPMRELRAALDAEQAQAVEPATGERAELISKLRDIGYPECVDAADMLEADGKAQQVVVPAWTAEQIDEFEIRVKSPEGEAWRLRSADKNDIFNNFIWRWAQSMITA